jgi:RNA polymerase sigma-70 factor, ECF subfamily
MAVQGIGDEILLCLPHLRAFSRSLASNHDKADDLVQEAIVLALSAAKQFTLGTNFRAWIFTILRNRFLNDLRRNKHVLEPLDAADVSNLATSANQESRLIFDEFCEAFMTLPSCQRDALFLVTISGYSYQEAAMACACAVGTIKSRVSRARANCRHYLGERAFAPERDPSKTSALALGIPEQKIATAR